MLFDLVNFARTSDLHQRLARIERRLAALEAGRSAPAAAPLPERQRTLEELMQQPAPPRPRGPSTAAMVFAVLIVGTIAMLAIAILAPR